MSSTPKLAKSSRFPAGTLEQLFGFGAIEQRLGRASWPAALQPGVQSRPRWALIEAVTGVLNSRRPGGQRLRKLYCRLTHGGQYNKAQAKVALAREMAELVYVIWKKRTPYSDTPPSRPGMANQRAAVAGEPRRQMTGKQAMRPDQSRHPIARAGRRPSARLFCNWTVRAACPFCAERICWGHVTVGRDLPQHVGIIGFLQTAKCHDAD